MDFDLTDEQRLLKDSVDRLIADQYQFEQRKKYMAEPDGWSRAVWQQYAELGLLGLPFAEAHGGFGGGPVETMIVMEAFGRGLVLEPYFATVILGGGLLRRAASPAQQQALLPQVAQGKLEARLRACRAALALRSGRCRHHRTAGWRDVGAGRCQERRAARRLRRPSAGDRADVRRSPRSSWVSGCSWSIPSAAGVTRRGYPTQDGLRAAEVTLSGVRVPQDDAMTERAAGNRTCGG